MSLILCSASAHAWYSVDYHQTTENPFSEDFTKDYLSVHEESGSPQSLTRLMEMLAKYKQPHEQAELELTLAMIYNQRNGLVDHAKAIEHFGNALHFDLPPTILVSAYLLQGNSYEALQKTENALADYLRGLAVCLHYPLPATLPAPPAVGRYSCEGEPDSLFAKKVNEEQRKQVEHRRQVMFERKMLMEKCFLIDAIKRVSKNDAGQIQQAAEALGMNGEQIQKLATQTDNCLQSLTSPSSP